MNLQLDVTVLKGNPDHAQLQVQHAGRVQKLNAGPCSCQQLASSRLIASWLDIESLLCALPLQEHLPAEHMPVLVQSMRWMQPLLAIGTIALSSRMLG